MNTIIFYETFRPDKPVKSGTLLPFKLISKKSFFYYLIPTPPGRQAGLSKLEKGIKGIFRDYLKKIMYQILSVFYLSVIICLFACKKEEPSSSKVCRVHTITTSGAAESVLNIDYDDDGRIAVASRDAAMSAYAYTGNKIVILTVDDFRLSVSTNVELNEQGLVQKITSVFINEDGNPSAPIVETYEYNDKGEVQKKTRQAWNNAPTTTVYIWENGNMVNESDGNSYEYFTDQAIQDSDPLRRLDIIGTGAVVFRNKNLVSRISNDNSGFTENITYDFDNEGKIIKINGLINNETSLSRTIQYICE